ncbi:DUF4403 family protein [Corallococcus sp. CA049B]|uniref:DUF4403 family protein n=1 Tax=Corallococcus sp. CA049B TaxID=2316730 RepID=UPI0013150FB1|nr:DUF4403 family protein [Corallococcus sp. CA049B]
MSSMLALSGLTLYVAATQAAAPQLASQPLVTDEPSRITVRVATPLNALQILAESSVPPEDIKTGAWTMVDNDSWGLKWEVRREPMVLTTTGQTLRIGTTLHYKAWACKREKKPWPLKGHICPQVASCSGAMQAWLDATPQVTPEWSVDLHEVPGTHPLSRCKVTFLNIDVTDRITSALTSKLGEVAGTVEERLSKTLYHSAETAWKEIQEPLALGQDLWLNVAPQGMQLASSGIQDAQLVHQIHLLADVRVGSRKGASPVTPLPKQLSGIHAPDFRIVVDGEVDYSHASRLLRESLRGRTYELQGRTLTITDASIQGQGGKAVVKVDLSGGENGVTLYLVGVPHYEPSTQVLSIQDLDFSVETKDVVLQLASLLFHDQLRDDIDQRTRWQFPDLGAAITRATTTSLNRSIGEKAKLEIQLSQVHVRRVETSELGFRVTAHIDGNAAVTATP